MCYFCTRNSDRRSFKYWQANGIESEKNIFKKDYKKLVRFEIGCYLCTPQNIGKFIERLVDKAKKKEIKISLKKLQKTFAG